MNSITILKLAGLGEAAATMGRGAKRVFQASGAAGAELGKLVGAEGPGKLVGYAAPVLAANYAANQYAPTRRAKAWAGERIATGSPTVGRLIAPSDFGMRPGDYPADAAAGYGNY